MGEDLIKKNENTQEDWIQEPAELPVISSHSYEIKASLHDQTNRKRSEVDGSGEGGTDCEVPRVMSQVEEFLGNLRSSVQLDIGQIIAKSLGEVQVARVGPCSQVAQRPD